MVCVDRMELMDGILYGYVGSEVKLLRVQTGWEVILDVLGFFKALLKNRGGILSI